VVLGGDRRAVDTVLADPRLAPLRPLAVEHRLDVPDPRLRVLRETPKLFRSVSILVREPEETRHDGGGGADGQGELS
jgi:Actinobacteria/chloroflexi VLRF1 release factor